MSEQVVPDPIEFARGRQSVEGEIALIRFERLRESLASNVGAVRFKLTGFVDEGASPGLRCEVQGILKVQCQRCLESMDYHLEIDNSLLLMQYEPEESMETDPDAPDSIMVQRDLQVEALVEEEMLLALPMAPHHAENVCKGSPSAETGKLHPFAVLASLKAIKE